MSDVTFEEFDAAELATWLERTRGPYIDERVAAGDTVAEATANAEQSMERTFPGGKPARGQLSGWVSYEGARVGELWVGPYGDDPSRWWVWNIEIDEPHRGKGLGRKTMLLAEELARSHGATTIGLNVFAHNQVARGLYTSLGYDETSVQMRKALAPD